MYKNKTGIAGLGLIYLLLIVDYTRILKLEWLSNEQYAYGILIPLIATGFLWRRLVHSPVARPPQPNVLHIVTTLQFIGLALLIPFNIIYFANPDWRMLFWLYGAFATAFGLSWSFKLGGWPWMRFHLAGWFIFLLAIPWPTILEETIISALMNSVAISVTELLQLFGILAQRTGHLIQLEGGFVGVEEACSGIRSFQIALVSAYLFGELEWLSKKRRIFLISLGIVTAFVVNLIRTLGLTLIFEFQGAEGMAIWHDPIGNMVMIIVIIIIWLLTLLISKKKEIGAAIPPSFKTPNPITCAIMACVGILSYAGAELYYQSVEKDSVHSSRLLFNFVPLPPEAKEIEIPPATKALLRYSRSVAFHYDLHSDGEIIYYQFNWEGTRVSSFAGIHRPEICLPSAGIELVHVFPKPRILEINGASISFDTYEFKIMGRQLFVYFSIRDNRMNSASRMAGSVKERIEMAKARERIREREMIEIIHYGASSEEEAWKTVSPVLWDHAIIINSRAVE